MKGATFFRVPSPTKRHTSVLVHRWSRLLLLLPTLFLQSCLIEGEEEIWIDADGAGKVRIQYTLPTRMVKTMGDPQAYIRAIREIDEKEDGAKVTALSFEEIGKQSLLGGQSRFIMEAEFDDVLKFFEIAERNEQDFVAETGADSDDLENIAGDIDLEMNLLTPRVKRTISLDHLLPPTARKFPNALGKSSFSYTYHIPFPIEKTNAHYVSEDKKTVRWKFLLKEHVDKPLVMELETSIPLPWWLIAIIVILSLIVIRVLYRVIRGK